MGFFNRKKEEERAVVLNGGYDSNSLFLGTISTGFFGGYSKSNAMKLATVNRCVNLISDSIASLPINPYIYKGNWKVINYESTLYNLLNVQPNAFQSEYTFKKMIVVNMLLKGNSYILITRNNKGVVQKLELLNSDLMMVELDGKDIKYNYGGNKFDKSQIIHLMNHSVDGITGISTLNYASETLGLVQQSETHAKNFFSGAMSGILKPVLGANISDGKSKKAKEDLNTAITAGSNQIIVLDSSFEYQNINLNSKDLQLLDSRKFNITQIASFFGVPPSLAFSEGAKFSTAEQEQLGFKTNCLIPLTKKIESEFFRKLFLPSEWATSDLRIDKENLILVDAVSQADYYTKLFQVGGFTTNEIREKLNAGFPVTGGNRAFIQVNLQPVDNLISEQTNTTDPNNQIDNKLKGQRNLDDYINTVTQLNNLSDEKNNEI